MAKIFKPWKYQDFGIKHVIQNLFCGLFIDMGLGKTVLTLTAFIKLMFEDFEIDKPLVIAPKKVAEHTWPEEVAKWEHTKHLKLSVIAGTERQRIEALKAKADIYVVSRDNIAWLVTYLGGAWPFDALIIDELSSFKNESSQRFKALRIIRPFVKRVVALTGTPAGNGLLDLWAEMYLIDQGERLGKTFEGFRTRYFRKNEYSAHGKYEVIQNDDERGADYYEKKIMNKISDICISMKKEDYLDLPKRIDRINLVELPPAIRAKYNAFERDLILSLSEEQEITAVNAGVLTNKLLQFANGAVYDDERTWHEMHKEKLEALAEDIEAANGQPVLIFYSYKHDVERIKKHLKEYKPVLLTDSKQIDQWNRKEIPVLLAHPASAGHGLNMQDGGNLIIWFGVQWGLELYLQAVARLDRQGQTKPVINTRIIAAGTIDEDVMAAIERKTSVQDAVMDAVKARIEKYKKVAA